MFATDPNTTPLPYDSYKKDYNAAGNVSKVTFFKEGNPQFSWNYSYDDAGEIETGCQIEILKRYEIRNS